PCRHTACPAPAEAGRRVGNDQIGVARKRRLDSQSCACNEIIAATLHIGSAQTEYQLRTACEPCCRCRQNVCRGQIAMKNVGPYAAERQYKSLKWMQQIP